MCNEANTSSNLKLFDEYFAVDDVANPLMPTGLKRIDKALKRVSNLHRLIEAEFLKIDALRGDEGIDYEYIDEMSREIEALAQIIDDEPVKSVSIAKKKIAFYIAMVGTDHPDPTKVNILEDKVMKVLDRLNSPIVIEETPSTDKP